MCGNSSSSAKKVLLCYARSHTSLPSSRLAPSDLETMTEQLSQITEKRSVEYLVQEFDSIVSCNALLRKFLDGMEYYERFGGERSELTKVPKSLMQDCPDPDPQKKKKKSGHKK